MGEWIFRYEMKHNVDQNLPKQGVVLPINREEFSNGKWEISREDLDIDEKAFLGSGAFSNVYLGLLREQTLICFSNAAYVIKNFILKMYYSFIFPFQET